MKFSEKFKKNKGEAAVPETAQDSGKKKHKPDPKKLVGTISKKHIKNGSYSMAMAAVFIVIVVVINMIVGAIPSKYSQLDVSSSKLYTIGDETKKVLNVFNLSGHYDNFTKGVFDVTGIVYFISVIAICLFLTMQSIQKRRWN